MSAKRRSLQEMMSEDQFVFGEETPDNASDQAEQSNATESKQPDLVERLKSEEKQATKRFTVDLNLDLHRKLSVLSAQTGRTKADIVRQLLRETLEDVQLES